MQCFNLFFNKSNLYLKNPRSILIMRNSFKRIGEGKGPQEPYQGSVLKSAEGTRGEMSGSFR